MSFDNSLRGNILIRLLKSISNEEWKEFEKFVASPFFNEGRNYLPLLKILKKFHPEFNDANFTKENIYKKLYPGKEFKESVLNSMFSRLYNVGEEYLIHISVKNDNTYLKKRLIIRELRSRGVMLKLNKSIKDNLDYFSTKKVGFKDFNILYEFNSELNKLNQINNRSEIFYNSITDLIKYTTYNFLLELNLYMSSIYSLKNYWKEDFDKSYLLEMYESFNFEKTFSILKENDYKNYLPLKLTHLSYLSTRYPENDDYYYEMKNLYINSKNNFDQDLKEIISNNLSAICSMKLILGKSNFKYESFEIRKIALEENLLFRSGEFMKIGDFRSYFLDSLNVGQIEWGKELIKKFIHKIHPDFRGDIRNYCNAWIACDSGDFDKAVEYAIKVNVNQITFKLDIKNILSRAYFGTNSTEPLLSLLNSYYQLIKNSDSKNKTYLRRQSNFIKYLRKLITVKEKGSDSTELQLLKFKIESENVSGKSWFIKQIDLLLKE